MKSTVWFAASSLVDLTYPEWELQAPQPQPPLPEPETPLILVDSEEGMKSLISDLKKETSFAIDLEHHDYRSYQGFTCLIQVLGFPDP